MDEMIKNLQEALQVTPHNLPQHIVKAYVNEACLYLPGRSTRQKSFTAARRAIQQNTTP